MQEYDNYNNNELNKQEKKSEDYNDWVESNKDFIIEHYSENLELEDVPEDYIISLFETYSEEE